MVSTFVRSTYACRRDSFVLFARSLFTTADDAEMAYICSTYKVCFEPLARYVLDINSTDVCSTTPTPCTDINGACRGLTTISRWPYTYTRGRVSKISDGLCHHG